MGIIISSSYLTDEKTEAQRNNLFKVPELVSDPGFKLGLTDPGVYHFPMKLGLRPLLQFCRGRHRSAPVQCCRKGRQAHCDHVRFFNKSHESQQWVLDQTNQAKSSLKSSGS